VADRRGQPEHLVELPLDQPLIEGGPDQLPQSGPLRGLAGDVEPPVGQVPDPGREPEAQEVAQREDMVGEAGRVRVMLLDPQVGLVVEQAVQDVRGIADRGVDHLGVERGILVGDVRVEGHARLGAVSGVDLPGRLPRAAGAEPLAVRGRSGPRAPVPRQGEPVLVVDEFSQRLAVGLVADMPGDQPGEAGEAGPR
jgi:hypothetical protein